MAQMMMDISALPENKLERRHQVLKNNVAERKRLLEEDQAILDDFEEQLANRKEKEAK